MIRIEELSESNLTEASELADRIFFYEPIKPSEAFRASLNEEQFDKLLKKSPVKFSMLKYWVAVDSETNSVVGTTGVYELQDDENEAVWLGWFCVDPSYRGKKIGSQLLDFAIEKAKGRQKKFFRLYTSTNPVEAQAQGLYESRGLQRDLNRIPEPDGEYEVFYRELKLS